MHHTMWLLFQAGQSGHVDVPVEPLAAAAVDPESPGEPGRVLVSASVGPRVPLLAPHLRALPRHARYENRMRETH